MSDYANHFAELIAEESGKPMMLARTEVSDAVLLLRGAIADAESGVLGIVGDARMPLLAALRHAESRRRWRAGLWSSFGQARIRHRRYLHWLN